jgi:lysozyme
MNIDTLLRTKPAGFKPYIRGVDVSHWNEKLDYKKLKAAGIEFMFIKATDGDSTVDPAFRYHLNNARDAGILCGAYHFFRQMPADNQITNFLKTIEHVTLDLPPVCDWEDRAKNLERAYQQQEAKKWLNAVESKTKQKPIIYMDSDFPRDLALNSAFNAYPLWLASYVQEEAKVKVPKPWANWTFLQYTDKAKIDGGGIGYLDADYFFGTIDQLKALQKTL